MRGLDPNVSKPIAYYGRNATGCTSGLPVNASATAVKPAVNRRRGWRDAGPRPYVLLVVLWFLYLFAPFKLIPYYVPAARPLSWIPELLLWVCAIQWLRWPAPRRGYPAYTWFMVVLILGTGVAFALGNWGVARDVLRVMYQYYLLGVITLTFCTTPERARPILALYFGYFLWYGLWGLISLKTSPLGADVDPGARVIVPWHTSFDNRDAFGPLMVAGLAYGMYYCHANQALRTRAKTAWCASSIGLCALGFITSFGRGAFVGFLAAATSMWLRSRRKIAVLPGLAIAIGAFAFVAPQLSSRYLQSIETITEEGMTSGTGADRADLWGIAWREFLSSPIVGVGTANYGPGGQRVLSPEEETAGGYTQGRLFERVPHSAPMQILAEYGLFGVAVTLALVVDFFRTNRRTRINAAKPAGAGSDTLGGFPAGYVAATALGLHAAFLAICVSSIFYELLYTPLLWTLIVLNRMLYFSSGADLGYRSSPSGS
jgi:O-antigen ligase